MDLLSALGRSVRNSRESLGLSRRSLAQRAGLSIRFLAQLESGTGNISVSKLEKLARAMGLAAADLLAGSNGLPQVTLSADALGELRQEVAELVALCPPEHLQRVISLLRNGLLRNRGETDAEPHLPIIALIGLRGAGKSTVGPLLAERLGVPFVELDALIEDAGGLAIPEIFELHGERYYRESERRALRELIDGNSPVVVAVSGGIVNDPQSFAMLKGSTRLVWLRATPADHMARVAAQGDHRPMRNRPDAMAELKGLLGVRTPFYRQAAFTIDTTGTKPETCVWQLASQLAVDTMARSVDPDRLEGMATSRSRPNMD